MDSRFGMADNQKVRRLVELAIVCLLTVFAVALLLPDGWHASDSQGVGHDIVFEWVTARTLLEGGDVYAPIGELGAVYGYEFTLPDSVYPRLPGGVISSVWVGALPAGRILFAGLVTVGLGMGLIVWLAEKVTRRRMPLWVVPLVALTPPFTQMIVHRSTVWVTAGAVLGCWYLTQHRDSPSGGILLGVAAVGRLWPGVLIPFLWFQGRRKAALAAGGVFVGLNLVGMAGGLGLGESLAALASQDSWVGFPLNTTLVGAAVRAGVSQVGAVAVGVVLIVAVVWWASRQSYGRGFGAVLLAGLVLTPKATPHYRVALLPLGFSSVWWLLLTVELAQTVYVSMLGVPHRLEPHGWYSLASTVLLMVWLRRQAVQVEPGAGEEVARRGDQLDRVDR